MTEKQFIQPEFKIVNNANRAHDALGKRLTQLTRFFLRFITPKLLRNGSVRANLFSCIRVKT